MDFNRRTIVRRFQLHAELMESIDEILNGTFSHPAIAVDHVLTMAKSEKRGKKPCGRSGIADKEVGVPGGNLSTQAGNGHLTGGLVELNVEAKGLQGVRKVTGIIRKESIGEARRSGGQSSNQQCPIGQGFGAGDSDRGGEGVVKGSDLHGGTGN
jgi:hypothetical protein